MSNVETRDAAAACLAIDRYALRWRIEQFHRTWKSGVCHVEDTQLRSVEAVMKWATILGAVATRAESLRQTAREHPDAPATEILSDTEIRALVLMKQASAKRTETISAEGLTIAKAVRWIADLGGYVGNNNSGKPGAITIGRGLERLLVSAQTIDQMTKAGLLR